MTIIKYAIAALWIIVMYEGGKNHLNPDYFKNWKAIIVLILIIAFYSYAIVFNNDPETGYSPDFDLDFFLEVFIPTAVAMLIGLYVSKKK